MILDKNCITLVSSENINYMNWQVKLLYRSWLDVGQSGDFVNILADEKYDRYSFEDEIEIKTFRHPSKRIINKDLYPPYNKPFGLKYFLDNIEPCDDRMILWIDSDCLFVNNFNEEIIKKENFAQYIDYMRLDLNGFSNKCKKYYKFKIGVKRDFEEHYQPVGIPIIIRELDFRKVVNRWIELVQILRTNNNDNPLLKDWVAEMWALNFSLAEYEIKFNRYDQVAHPPWDCGNPNYKLIHYCYSIKEGDNTIFDKKQYKAWNNINMAYENSMSKSSLYLCNYINSYIKQYVNI
jgi:hypothetical protein